jgi:chorismate mutase/prephenate dehydratase
MESDLKICSEVLLEIEHNLLSKGKLSSIKKVYSNPQVLGQCRLWLETNLAQAELIPVSSTTKAAQIAAKTKAAAAIASKVAADRYGLKILAESIEDSPHNITRFLVIGKTDVEPTGDDKTSIMFSVKDRIGVLHDMLGPFKRNRINLTKIESRPSKKEAWKYYFFADMKGHIKDKKVRQALDQLERYCAYLKILGSYPAAE